MEIIESKRDISQEWIRNNVYEALENIEECERRMKNGCADLIDFIRSLAIPINRLAEVQIKNMEIMITELDILIENTKKLMTEKNYKEVRAKLNVCKEIFSNGVKFKDGKVLKIYKRNNVNKKNPVTLTNLYYKLVDELSSLRSRMIEILSPLLYVTKDVEEKNIEY